ncbi:hypothetical protein ANCCAN_20286 [Ancylostoma caninum]|uniref:VWFA domain-containing protein n=1 Tax=Ancylostoma caninum TaxID=29170 RepID=A0A368FST1_ANCCA|nr:hypothetical protein ANCCAN_20286 [Ancylostoma caninum]
MRAVIALASLFSLALASKLCLQAPCIPQAIDADFTFVIDVSSAVSYDDFSRIKQWLLDFTSQLTLSNYDSQVRYSFQIARNTEKEMRNQEGKSLEEALNLHYK